MAYRPHLTGDHVADLLDTADADGIHWTNIHGLPQPYITDRTSRIVYVDGRLTLPHYYEAVADGIRELRGGAIATVTDLTTRQRYTG